MRSIRTAYIAVIALTWFLNGFALLEHLGLIPEIKGLIAAVLLTNMVAAPIALWGAFVFGEFVEDRTPHRWLRLSRHSRWHRHAMN